MSPHNIGFYEDLTKIIFELSSNIIKYAPYFFCCDSNEQPLHRLLWRTDKNHHSSIIKYIPYLFSLLKNCYVKMPLQCTCTTMRAVIMTVYRGKIEIKVAYFSLKHT